MRRHGLPLAGWATQYREDTMEDNPLEQIEQKLRSQDPHTILETLVELNRSIPKLDRDDRERLASAVSSLFYIDTVDMPEFTTVVDMAVKVVAGMGPDLIPYHLQEMQGTDFKALLCFARVLAALGTESINPIVEACEASDETHLLIGAVYALSKIRDESVLKGFPLIVGLCKNPAKELRDTAVRAVGKLVEHLPPSCFTSDQTEEAFEALMAATHDSSPGIRAKAMRGLGKMEGRGLLNAETRERTQERIRQVLGQHETYSWDTAYIVRREAEEALEHFRG
jgi:HEAT repeat protein